MARAHCRRKSFRKDIEDFFHEIPEDISGKSVISLSWINRRFREILSRHEPTMGRKFSPNDYFKPKQEAQP